MHTGIFISSNILGSLVQIASLPVVILAPLGAVSLLWNALFARLLLGDVFSPFMIFGTLAIAGGAVLIAVFGIVPEPTHSLESLLILFGRKPFIVYFSLLGATVIGVLVLVSNRHCENCYTYSCLPANRHTSRNFHSDIASNLQRRHRQRPRRWRRYLSHRPLNLLSACLLARRSELHFLTPSQLVPGCILRDKHCNLLQLHARVSSLPCHMPRLQES